VIAWCTYCSAAKREDPGLLPAVERYLDRRIRDLAMRAADEGVLFLILSGKYGLLRPVDPIPWYDHLLAADEVEGTAGRVAVQLREFGVSSLRFHTVDRALDPQLEPYLKTIRAACDRADVAYELEIVEA
jgi:hypothetical protein